MQPHPARIGEEMLPVTPDVAKRSAPQRARELRFSHITENARIEHAHTFDLLLQRVLGEVATIDFDFR